MPGIYQLADGKIIARGRKRGSEEPPGTAIVEIPAWMWKEAVRRLAAGILQDNPVTEADEPFVTGS
jgi:hypothetical protein